MKPNRAIDANTVYIFIYSNMFRLKDCILPRVEELCGESALNLVDDLIGRSIGKLPSTVCLNYDPLQTDGHCEKLLPEVGSKPHRKYPVERLAPSLKSDLILQECLLINKTLYLFFRLLYQSDATRLL